MRILVLRTDHLGDALLTTPLIRALAKAGHTVDFVLPAAHLPVLAGNPWLDEAVALESVVDDWRRQWFALSTWIARRHYDALILPWGREWPLLLASLFSGTPRRIAMFSGVAGRLTFHRCLRSHLETHTRYLADILLDCARALGVPGDGLVPDAAGGEEPPDARGPVPLVGVHPGCAGNTCNFPPAGYAEIVRLLLERTECEVVLTGTEKEKALLAGWDPALLASPRVRNTLGTLDLPGLSALLRTLDLFISTGTGPFHLAAALGTPTLTPFCPRPIISHAMWGNPRPNGAWIEASPESCSSVPAGTHCDFSGRITPEEIVAAALPLLAPGGKA
jgi:ADP-heptose:LPS heptosyltransferase